MENLGGSVNAGLWFLSEVRQDLKKHVEDVVKLRDSGSSSSNTAQALALKVDEAWCRNLERNGGLGDFVSLADEWRQKTAAKGTAPSVGKLPEESRSERISRMLDGRPAPYMPWPSWASRPWLADPKRQRGDEPDSAGPKTKWRRTAPEDRGGIEVPIEDDAFRQRITASVQKIDERRMVQRRERGLPEPDQDQAEILEQFEQLEDDTTYATLNRRFVDVATEGRMPTFFPPRNRRRDDDDDLGVDAETTDPPAVKALLHGRLRHVTVKDNVHILCISRAIAVIHGQLAVLFDSKLRLPFYWADDDPRSLNPRRGRSRGASKVIHQTTGAKQWRGGHRDLDDPLADRAIRNRIIARCSSGCLAACFANGVVDTSLPSPPPPPPLGDDDDDRCGGDLTGGEVVEPPLQ